MRSIATLASVAVVVCSIVAFSWVGLALLGFWVRRQCAGAPHPDRSPPFDRPWTRAGKPVIAAISWQDAI